jgi:hypothetical protein
LVRGHSPYLIKSDIFLEQDRAGSIKALVFERLVHLSADVISEGELVLLLYLKDFATILDAPKIATLSKLMISVISSVKYSSKKRMLALYICSAYAPILGVDNTLEILKVLQDFVETLEEEEKIRVYRCMKLLSDHVGGKHPVLKNLVAILKKVSSLHLTK